MSKLKTLKDLEKSERDYDFVFSLELKAEAIKWVKEIRQTLKEGLDIPLSDSIMMHFHNITEEELK